MILENLDSCHVHKRNVKNKVCNSVVFVFASVGMNF